MFRLDSTTPQGFSLFQATPGDMPQWLPAVGTEEHELLVHAFIPGPSSIQDKRAHISMDFYEFSQQTGQNFKFYPVYNVSPTSTAAASPASSSAAVYDSGYGSSFDASPAASDMSPWFQHPVAFAHTPAASLPRQKSRSSPKKMSAGRSAPRTDVSGHPGMRIMTKDGRDVTDLASKSCKTKEQRDHAHLMRIIKACDSCRRKKIRCDPSHKKRTASQAASQARSSRPEPNPAKKATFQLSTPSSLYFGSADADLQAPNAIPELNLAPAVLSPPGTQPAVADPADDLWEQFISYDDNTTPVHHNSDHFSDPAGYLTPARDWSYSNAPLQSRPPSTSLPPVPLPPTPPAPGPCGVLPESSSSAPTLPYLNPGGVHGCNYLDFNLYSPASDFLDEEPLTIRKLPVRDRGQDAETSLRSQNTVQSPALEPSPLRMRQTSLGQGLSHMFPPLLICTLDERHGFLDSPGSADGTAHSGTHALHQTPSSPPSSSPGIPGRASTQSDSGSLADHTPSWSNPGIPGRASTQSDSGSIADHTYVFHLRVGAIPTLARTKAHTVAKRIPKKTSPEVTSAHHLLTTPMSSSYGPVPESSSSPLLSGLGTSGGVVALSGVVAAFMPPTQPMRNTKTLMLVCLWHVLVSGLKSCLLVSEMDSQRSGLWFAVSAIISLGIAIAITSPRSAIAIISLGSAVLLARNSREPNFTARRPCVSTENNNNGSTPTANAVGTVKPKARDMLSSTQRLRCAATKLLTRHLGRLGSVVTARLGRS